MNRYLALLGLFVLVYGSGCCATRCCTPTCCSSCGKTCSPEVKEIETAHNCYADKCKDVCIPAIRFPWEDCCDPLRCGKVRSVKVLTKWEYKCPDCEVKWNVVNSGCSGNGCNGSCGGNCAIACGDPSCGTSASPTPAEAPGPMPPVVTPEEHSPSEVPPMPPMVIQQTQFYAPAS
ncbi:hypothetical protein [Blastopirellula marina]|uniref:4Fe-4S ferredoxin-type domain-containing protein n=1 Tax=Blastopirellula marina TaxID=124 RepID=A0A2S8G0M2_9BACT|nr:hypothetical protein [Blastopirellula marina]PQO37995.1 hypothetical protein C5Y98_07860 [Blastopirellula marina]PTL44651.1 hypothetical protein C5Y97_07860 [Blastopirellula marina]